MSDYTAAFQKNSRYEVASYPGAWYEARYEGEACFDKSHVQIQRYGFMVYKNYPLSLGSGSHFCTQDSKSGDFCQFIETENYNLVLCQLFCTSCKFCSLVPRPRPAFRRFQYGKAGEGLE